MANSQKAQKVIQSLRNEPHKPFHKIAEEAGVSRPYVSMINADMGIRPVRTKGSDADSFDGTALAREDLRDMISHYATDRDKRMVLEGYMRAAKQLLELHGGAS